MSESLELSVKEVAALSGVSEKAVRNEVALGVATPRAIRRGRGTRRAFNDGAVDYFALISRLPLRVSRQDRRDLFRMLTAKTPHAGRWTRVGSSLRHADLVTVAAAPATAEARARLKLYRRGMRRIHSRFDILGGEPVFKGTRLSVLHIGGMALSGAPTEEILSDYPNLTSEDVEFASLYAAMKPGPGRPRRRLRFLRAHD